ncbi:MAG: tetratricopeptide repeat protein [Candidatus Xenobiia bacterium LiM19]
MKCTSPRLLQALSLAFIVLYLLSGSIHPALSQNIPSGDRAKAEKLMSEGMDLLKKRNPEYLTKFLEAKKADPSYGRPYFALGQIYRRNYNFDTAEKEYLLLIKLEPQDAMVHKSLGEIYTEWSDYRERKSHGDKDINRIREKAVAELKKADSLKFKNNQDELRNKMEIYKLLGKNFTALGDYRNAIEFLDKARQMNEKDCEIRLYMGKALKGNKQLKEAEVELKEAIALSPHRQLISNEAKRELNDINQASGAKLPLNIEIAAALAVLIIVTLAIVAFRSRKK